MYFIDVLNDFKLMLYFIDIVYIIVFFLIQQSILRHGYPIKNYRKYHIIKFDTLVSFNPDYIYTS
jgi:hypothetical protein